MCDRGATVRVDTPDWLWSERTCPENGIAIDACIADLIVEAWDKGVRTLGSCCGHDETAPSIVLAADPEQPALARAVLPWVTLYQWKLTDVSQGQGVAS